MKIREGFVSNSSSTSYVICVKAAAGAAVLSVFKQLGASGFIRSFSTYIEEEVEDAAGTVAEFRKFYEDKIENLKANIKLTTKFIVAMEKQKDKKDVVKFVGLLRGSGAIINTLRYAANSSFKEFTRGHEDAMGDLLYSLTTSLDFMKATLKEEEAALGRLEDLELPDESMLVTTSVDYHDWDNSTSLRKFLTGLEAEGLITLVKVENT